MAAMMDATDFPRGPGPDPVDEGHRKRQKQGGTLKKQKRRKQQEEAPLQLEFTTAIGNSIDIQSPNFRSPGVKSLGMVTEVSETHLRVSLPHGVEESIQPTEASDVVSALLEEGSRSTESKLLKQLHGSPRRLTELFVPGQFVRGTYFRNAANGVVFSLKLSRFHETVRMSSVPEGSLVSGCVRTVEDHGYTLSFGTQGVSGFLKSSDVETFYGNGASLLPGQVLDCVIKSTSARGVLQLTVDPESVKNCMVIDGGSNDPQPVLPGALVYAKISRILNSGIVVTFMKNQRGVVSVFHLPQDEVIDDWQTAYCTGQVVKARVLSWHPAKSEYVMSLKPFLVAMDLPRMPAIIGQVFEDAKIKRVDPTGLSLRLPTQPSATMSYVFRSSLGDLPVESRDFKLNQLVSMRVTGFHALDGLIVGSMKESVIRSGIVCFGDIYPGLIAEGSLTRIYDDRVVVSMGEGIEGWSRQCGFSANISLRTIFNEGQVVSYRVLKMRPELRQVMLSLDAKLVHASLPFLTSWDDAEVGMRVIGYVLAVKPDVVVISFANDVHGILPLNNVKLNDGESLSECFRKNQVVKTWIKSYHLKRKKIFLTLVKEQLGERLHEPKAEQDPLVEACKAPDSLCVGDIAEAVVVKAMKRNDGYLVKYTVHGTQVQGQAVLPMQHVSDHPMVKQVFTEAAREGSAIGDVVVFKTTPAVKVSRKRSFVKNASVLPRELEDVKEDMLIHGYVSSLGEDYLNVSFLGGLSGRAFKSQLPLPSISPLKQFAIGQSVHVRAVKVDPDRGRIHLTMNPSRTTRLDAVFLEEALEDVAFLRSLTSTAVRISSDQIGHILDVTIEAVDAGEAKGTVMSTKGIIPADQFDRDPPDISTANHKACLLDVTSEGIAVLSLKPHLLERGFKYVKKTKKKRKHRSAEEKLRSAIVEHITEHYVVVSLPEDDYAIAVVSTSDYNLQHFHLSKGLQLGDRLQVEKAPKTSTAVGCTMFTTQLIPLLWKRCFREEPSATQASESFGRRRETRLQIGDIVSAAVESIEEGRVRFSVDSEQDTRAMVPFIDLFDLFTNQVVNTFLTGLKVRGIVVKRSDTEVSLSLRESDGGKVAADVRFMNERCPVHLSREDIERGAEMYGYISGYGRNSQCLFVSIARDLYATVYPPHLADDPVTDVDQLFPIGTLVKGTVVSCNYPKVGLSLRTGTKPLDTVGAVKTGTVASILPQGVYIALDDSGIQGLVPRYDLKPYQTKELKKEQRVAVRVSSLTDAFHLVLNLVESEEAVEVENPKEEHETQEDKKLDDAEFEHTLATAVQAERGTPMDVCSNTPDSEARTEVTPQLKRRIWGEVHAKKKPNVQEQPSVSRMDSLVKVEEAVLQREEPKSGDDFERLLFSHPNSSYLWIRYMASFVEMGNITKARATAERALETIDFRHEKERLDIWLAYLNLERTQGGTTDSIMALFQRAVLCNDPKKLHLAFLGILEASKQTEIGDLVIKSIYRRCSSSAKAYIHTIHFWLSTGRGRNCKRTLDMALNNLPKRKHVKVIEQAGIMEFKIGTVERGRDIFEGLVSCYPKRMDLWNVYLDQELAQNDDEHVRALFERVSSIDGGRKKMKWIFKRFLQFEMEHGTQNTVDRVKDKAREYIATKNDELDQRTP